MVGLSCIRVRATKVPLRSMMVASVLLVTVPASLAWAQDTCDPPCSAGQICGVCGRGPNGKPPGVPCCTQKAPPPLPAPMTTLGQALVSIGNITYEFAVSSDEGPHKGHVLYTQWQLGGGGQGWTDLGPINGDVTAATAPAAAAVGNYIFLTVTGTDSHIYLNQGTPPNWVGWR